MRETVVTSGRWAGTEGRPRFLIMDVEVKERGANVAEWQRRVHAFKHQLCRVRGKNMHGAKTDLSVQLIDATTGRLEWVRYFGHHLLQFSATNPNDSAWIKWDHELISYTELVGVLAMTLDPHDPKRAMTDRLKDKHAKTVLTPELFGNEVKRFG